MEQLVFVTLPVAMEEGKRAWEILPQLSGLTNSMAYIISTHISFYKYGRNAISPLVQVDQKYLIKSSNNFLKSLLFDHKMYVWFTLLPACKYTHPPQRKQTMWSQFKLKVQNLQIIPVFSSNPVIAPPHYYEIKGQVYCCAF